MYAWRKGIAQWKIKDTLYLSVVFTWHLPAAKEIAKPHKGPVIAGGPAVFMMPDYLSDVATIEHATVFPALAMHNPLATFTTRGCPNTCSFCAVPRMEGCLQELDTWPIRPVVCDNNLLAASTAHFDRVIDSLKPLPFVDFNQGLDARLFTAYHAKRIAELNAAKVRFAFDHISMESAIIDAITIARSHGLKDFGVYVLVNHEDTPEDAIYRLEVIRGLKIDPNPMRFQPLNTLKRNDYIAPGWNEYTLQEVMQFYARLVPMRICGISFAEFEPKTVFKEQGGLFAP